jgi:hypothetical protein
VAPHFSSEPSSRTQQTQDKLTTSGGTMTSPAGIYGMDDGHLASIINATTGAISRMNSVNGTVQDQASTYIHVNQSDSGRIMQEALTEWTDQFNRIVYDLEQLNSKVTLVRQQNLATTNHAAAAAQGYRSRSS